jgi:hypothetical protein
VLVLIVEAFSLSFHFLRIYHPDLYENLLIKENQIRTIIGIIRSRSSSSVNELISSIVFDDIGIILNGLSNVDVLL